ncbi:unnamed protein product [Caretta caretta]
MNQTPAAAACSQHSLGPRPGQWPPLPHPSMLLPGCWAVPQRGARYQGARRDNGGCRRQGTPIEKLRSGSGSLAVSLQGDRKVGVGAEGKAGQGGCLAAPAGSCVPGAGHPVGKGGAGRVPGSPSRELCARSRHRMGKARQE